MKKTLSLILCIAVLAGMFSSVMVAGAEEVTVRELDIAGKNYANVIRDNWTFRGLKKTWEDDMFTITPVAGSANIDFRPYYSYDGTTASTDSTATYIYEWEWMAEDNIEITLAGGYNAKGSITLNGNPLVGNWDKSPYETISLSAGVWRTEKLIITKPHASDYWRIVFPDQQTDVNFKSFKTTVIPASIADSEPVAPVVESVNITGIVQVGRELVAETVVSDGNILDSVSASYQWEYYNGEKWEPVVGGDQKAYIVDEAYVGKQLRVTVTPVSSSKPSPGEPLSSEPTEAVIAYVYPPSSKDAIVTGEYEAGGELILESWEYVPSQSGISKGGCVVVWETSATEDGDYTAVQTSGETDKYIVQVSDVGRYIRARVIPYDINGLEGESCTSKAGKVYGTQEFYVSVDGSDDNPGTKTAPFKTINKAKTVIKDTPEDSRPEGGIVVNIMGGIYPISDTIKFTSEDSGTADKPIIYQAYEGQSVSFIGGKALDSSKIKKVEDEKLLNRLVDENAKSQLYMLDLGAQGIEMNDLEPYGWHDKHQSYKPMRIYMNNTVLQDARWPNNDETIYALKAEPVLDDTTNYNAKNKPVKLRYPDEENRTAKWEVKSADAYIGGALAQFWNSSHVRIDNLDAENKIVTSVDPGPASLIPGDSWGLRYCIFFTNIFEEIDIPGESYVDRENDIVYFYPVGSVTDAEMIVSTLKKNMLTVTDAEYITFRGLDFKDTIETPVVLKNSKNIRFENSEIGNSSRGGIEMTNCKNTVITGCNIFSTGTTPLSISGGDRETLVSSGNIIENNYFHNTSLLPNNRASRACINILLCAGEIIRHNVFKDLPYGGIDIGRSNDITIEYNRFEYSGLETTDAGSIYWGRQADSLGIVVRYNYFENIGSKQVCKVLDGESGSYSLFIDDAGTGGHIYGNVMFNGGITGGFASNGSEFNNQHNNISIFEDASRTNNGIRVRAWGNNEKVAGVNKNIPFSSFLYHMCMRSVFGGSHNADYGMDSTSTWTGNYGQHMKARLWSDEWAEHYANTQWKKTLDIFSKANYDALKVLYEANDADGMVKYINENIPNERTNHLHNNVALGVPVVSGDNNIYDNYLGTAGKITDDEKAMFVDYEGKNFALTEDGLAKVKTQAPEFEQIPFKKIGLLSNIVGHEPEVEINSEVIIGVAAAGNSIAPSYKFTDADGDNEGATKFYWYVADKADGQYALIPGAAKRNFAVTEEYAGRFLKYEVIPYDTDILRGKSVMSDAIAVRKASSVDISKLSEVITEANALVNNAVVGTETGTYPQEAIDQLKAAIKEASEIANDEEAIQYDVNNAVKELTSAIESFKLTQNFAVEYVNVSTLIEDKEGWYNTLGAAVNDGKTITLKKGDVYTYTADKFLNTLFSFKMKLVTTDDVTPTKITLDPKGELTTDKASHNINGSGWMVRRKSEIGDVWKTNGYLMWMKNLTYEFQEYNPDDTKISYDNDLFTEFNKEYDITYGAYDTNGVTKVVLYVDGQLVKEQEFSDKNLGQEGYICFRGPSSDENLQLVISSADINTAEFVKVLADAEKLYASVKVGNGYGEYTTENKETLKTAIDAAKAVLDDKGSTQPVIDKAAKQLSQAMTSFVKTANAKAQVTGDQNYELNYNLPKADITVGDNSKVEITLDKTEMTPEIKLSTNTGKGMSSIYIPAGSVLSGNNWNGKITNPVYSEVPTYAVSDNLEVNAVYKSGDTVAKTDRLVKYVIPNAKNKKIFYLNENGKYVEIIKRITEDSFEKAESGLSGTTGAVKLYNGNDLIVYSNYITEIVIASFAEDEGGYENSGSSNGQNNYGSSSGGSSGGYFSTPILTPATATSTSVFADMTNHWAKNDVMNMYKAGIVSGVTANTFEPDRSITRAEFATLVTKALGFTVEKTNDFGDVKADDWFASYVGAAAKAGIIAGADGMFRPNDTITREEMAVIVVKAYEYLKKTAEKAELKFADKADVADWATEFVAKAVGAGLISGMGDGTFCPKAFATRAQAASIVSRIIK